MPKECKNAVFYEKYDFKLMEDGIAMQPCNFSDKRRQSLFGRIIFDQKCIYMRVK